MSRGEHMLREGARSRLRRFMEAANLGRVLLLPSMTPDASDLTPGMSQPGQIIDMDCVKTGVRKRGSGGRIRFVMGLAHPVDLEHDPGMVGVDIATLDAVCNSYDDIRGGGSHMFVGSGGRVVADVMSHDRDVLLRHPNGTPRRGVVHILPPSSQWVSSELWSDDVDGRRLQPVGSCEWPENGLFPRRTVSLGSLVVCAETDILGLNGRGVVEVDPGIDISTIYPTDGIGELNPQYVFDPVTCSYTCARVID